jgi:hypothetical protein
MGFANYFRVRQSLTNGMFAICECHMISNRSIVAWNRSALLELILLFLPIKSESCWVKISKHILWTTVKWVGKAAVTSRLVIG